MCNNSANISKVLTNEQTYFQIEEDEKYYEIFNVIIGEVKIKIKNSYLIIKNYISSFKVIGRTPKSNVARVKKTEDDSGSTDSGDPDQPEPPRSTHLTTPIPPQRNRSLFSWRTAPGYCSILGGIRA